MTSLYRCDIMLRYLTAGESHGPALTAIVEGFPSGIALDTAPDRPRAGAAPGRLRPRQAADSSRPTGSSSNRVSSTA